MSSYRQLLLMVKDLKQKLQDNQISNEEAYILLEKIEADYKKNCQLSADLSLKKFFEDLFEQEDDTQLNFLL